ncbi:unnamed protein product [Clonostachys rosea]|uniref:DUF1772 domain-containing protein n=1 Tax=Bionectria ochroleuca TaxID=29856 RepID=A0ABY6U5T1_BIOOC|nr:unnamed protein product [Clonostachys rosea]
MSLSAYVAAFKNTPHALYPLGAGLLITSSMLFGNIGLSLAGPLPIITEKLGDSTLGTKQKIRVWRLFYDAATPFIVGGTLATVALHGGAVYLTKNVTVKQLATASAVFSGIVLPFTLALIMPINKALIYLDEKEISKSESRQARALIKRWDVLHKCRFIFYGTGWLLSLAAIGVGLHKRVDAKGLVSWFA